LNSIVATNLPLPTAELLRAIREETISNPALRGHLRNFQAATVLLREGSENHSLHLILEGVVELHKSDQEDGESVVVDRLEPGSLLGLISFTTEEMVMTTARAATDIQLLLLDRGELASLGEKFPRLKALLDPLIIRNLAERYRRLVGSNLEIHQLARELRHERNELTKTVANLEATRLALVSREKLATLGQLVAGLAHELNNPTASLQHALQTLREKLSAILAGTDSLWAEVFQTALKRTPSGTVDQRLRMQKLAESCPQLSRPLIRRLARCPDELQERLLAISKTPGQMELLLDLFESGNALRSIGLSGERIVRLVKSLKSYSRDGSDEIEAVNIAEGIFDTLIMLEKKLTGIRVETKLDALPEIRCRPGAMNQVWTNLLVNACDAMGGVGELRIDGRVEDGFLIVRIEDNGPGIPEDQLPRLFAMNFTTKSGTSSFGLGLGLAISKDIVEQHHGMITAYNSNQLGGAVMEVRLPLK